MSSPLGLSQEQPTRPLIVIGHVNVKTSQLHWTCPRCGEQHARDVRPMVAQRVTAEWFTCPAGYYVAVSYQAAAKMRRVYGIPDLIELPTGGE